MNGMKKKGGGFSTDFGAVQVTDGENHLARLQRNRLDKVGTYFDQYNTRITAECKAGDTDVNYSTIINALHDGGINYREDRRYSVKPDRVIMEILVHKEDLDKVKDLNKTCEDLNLTFTMNDNLPEDVQPKVIVTPEKELDEKIKEQK